MRKYLINIGIISFIIFEIFSSKTVSAVSNDAMTFTWNVTENNYNSAKKTYIKNIWLVHPEIHYYRDDFDKELITDLSSDWFCKNKATYIWSSSREESMIPRLVCKFKKEHYTGSYIDRWDWTKEKISECETYRVDPEKWGCSHEYKSEWTYKVTISNPKYITLLRTSWINSIESIWNTPLLVTISLWSGNLKSIPSLEDSRNLLNLYINNNKITKIDKNDFDKLDRLSTISLANNNISSIEKGAFNNFSNKWINIDLSYNKLRSIPDEFLDQKKPTREINLMTYSVLVDMVAGIERLSDNFILTGENDNKWQINLSDNLIDYSYIYHPIAINPWSISWFWRSDQWFYWEILDENNVAIITGAKWSYTTKEITNYIPKNNNKITKYQINSTNDLPNWWYSFYVTPNSSDNTEQQTDKADFFIDWDYFKNHFKIKRQNDWWETLKEEIWELWEIPSYTGKSYGKPLQSAYSDKKNREFAWREPTPTKATWPITYTATYKQSWSTISQSNQNLKTNKNITSFEIRFTINVDNTGKNASFDVDNSWYIDWWDKTIFTWEVWYISNLYPKSCIGDGCTHFYKTTGNYNVIITWNDISKLSLRWNNVTSIQSIKCSSLKELDLNNTQINNLNPNIFNECKSLEEIQLKNTKIKEIESGTFFHLPSLTFLDLSSGSISIIEPQSFYLTWRSANLNLSQNKIREIKSETFLINWWEYSRVRLSDNEISNIEPNAFSWSSIDSFSLSNNKLFWINEWSFSWLKVNALILDKNLISSVSDKAFAWTTWRETGILSNGLNLINNKLSCIPSALNNYEIWHNHTFYTWNQNSNIIVQLDNSVMQLCKSTVKDYGQKIPSKNSNKNNLEYANTNYENTYSSDKRTSINKDITLHIDTDKAYTWKLTFTLEYYNTATNSWDEIKSLNTLKQYAEYSNIWTDWYNKDNTNSWEITLKNLIKFKQWWKYRIWITDKNKKKYYIIINVDWINTTNNITQVNQATIISNKSTDPNNTKNINTINLGNLSNKNTSTYTARNCNVYKIEYLDDLWVYTSPDMKNVAYFISADYLKKFIDQNVTGKEWCPKSSITITSYTDQSNSKSRFVAPNWKVYYITEKNWVYSSKQITSWRTFKSLSEIKEFIKNNNTL